MPSLPSNMIRTPAPPLNVDSMGGLWLDDSGYRRIPARLTAVNAFVIAGEPDQYRYAFVAQVFDPTDGIYSDDVNGLIADGVFTYATELNNQNVSGPFTTSIPADPGTGPLVWLRRKGVIDGVTVFEFNNVPANTDAFVEVLGSTTISSILLGRQIFGASLSGTTIFDAGANFTANDNGATVTGTGISAGTTISIVDDSEHATTSAAMTTETDVTVNIIQATVNGYSAVTVGYHPLNPGVGTWTTGNPCWFIGAGGAPTQPFGFAAQPTMAYPAKLIGTDYQGVPIYSFTPGAIIANVNSSTTVDGLYDCTLAYNNVGAWQLASNIWLLDANG